VPQFETGRLTGSRATAKERRSKTAAAPAPNKMHCQVAKVGLSYSSMSRQRALGGQLNPLEIAKGTLAASVGLPVSSGTGRSPS